MVDLDDVDESSYALSAGLLASRRDTDLPVVLRPSARRKYARKYKNV